MQTARSAARVLLAAALAGGVFHVDAAGPAEIRAKLEAAVRQSEPAFGGFSAERGREFFTSRHATDWSCASCHTDSPLGPGKHARTGKDIAPLAPGANAQRFTDTAKVEKWFKRNCGDVLNRACTAREKGDVLEYLISLGK